MKVYFSEPIDKSSNLLKQYKSTERQYKMVIGNLLVSNDSNSTYTERELLRKRLKELSKHLVELWDEIVSNNLQNKLDTVA